MKRYATFLILAAVIAGFLFSGAPVANAQPPMGAGGPGPGYGHGPEDGFHSMVMNLDLSDRQLDQMLDLQKDMQASQIKLQKQRRALMEEAGTLAEDPEGNKVRLGQIQKQLDEMEIESEKARLDHHQKVKSLLTDEQWQQLGVLRAEKMRQAPDGRPGCPGPEGRQGMGYGPGMGPGWGCGMGPCGQGCGPGPWRR